MRIRVVVATGLLGFHLAFSGPTSAEPVACTPGRTQSSALCNVDILDTIPGTSHGNDASTPGYGDSGPWEAYDRITTGPDGELCIATGYRRPGTTAPEDVNSHDGGTRDPATIYPRCPSQPGLESEDPAVIAARYWEEIPLPKPRPRIAPGWAITGKRVYLETNGQISFTATDQTPVGPLEIVATGTYHVDWGDGETSGPFSFEGRPWPEGEITHDYVWARTYDIVVTERWTAEWRLGGRSGTLRELRTEGRIEDFVARQIQAVVR